MVIRIVRNGLVDINGRYTCKTPVVVSEYEYSTRSRLINSLFYYYDVLSVRVANKQ